jgi:cytochrome c553
MRRFFWAVTMAACVVAGAHGLLRAAGQAPAWAYNVPDPPPAGAPPAQPAQDASPKKLSGSDASFTLAQIRDRFGPADWYPGDHPAMPEIVAKGRRPDVLACALCHYPNGRGRPENAAVSALPVEYFIQTMNDFKNGVRKSAEPRKANTNTMITIAKGMSDEDVKTAAAYFAAMPWTPWIKVVEAEMVPKTVNEGGMFVRLEGAAAGTEPLAQRIVEMPEHTEQTQLRNPRSGFIAYVPAGSIKKGEALATSGGGKTVECRVCHGPGLKGLGPVPGLAGRSPSYMVRQMYDMQQGARKGIWTDLMRPVVAKLTTEDLIAIAAYSASLAP